MVVAWSRGRREWEVIVNNFRVSVLQEETVLGMNGGDGCTII